MIFIKKNIYFDNVDNLLKENIEKSLLVFFKKMNIKNTDHIFIVGLGNDNHTADSVGPKTLKNINVNAYLDNIGFKIIGNKISALEPGVMGETGIKTDRIIKSVVKEIKPNLVIIIDSFITDDLKQLNRCIEINNVGIKVGNGFINDTNINYNTLGIKVIVIGIITAVNMFINDINYILTSKNIDVFVDKISKTIAYSINDAILKL